jgi:hypothetical protein
MIDDQLSAVAATTTRLFNALLCRDLVGARACYTRNAVYADPAYSQFDARHPVDGWRQIIRQANSLSICPQIEDIGLVTARIRSKVSYVFSPTNRPVTFDMTTCLSFRGQLVAHHDDSFDLALWARMALPTHKYLQCWAPQWRLRVRQVMDTEVCDTVANRNLPYPADALSNLRS